MKTILGALALALAVTSPAPAKAANHPFVRAASPASSPVTSHVRGTHPHGYLTLIDHGSPTKYGGLVAHRQRLVQIAPDGKRRLVFQHRVRHGARLGLDDWSSNTATALLSTRIGYPNARALVVDVATGAVTRVPLGADISDVMLAPGGDEVVATTFADEESGHDYSAPLALIGFDGTRTDLEARTEGPILAGRDGHTLITGGRTNSQHVLRTIDLTTGRTVAHVDTPGLICSPVRWWDVETVLATCFDRATGQSLTALARPAVGDLHVLTKPHHNGRRAAILDYGDYDARRAGGRLFLQATGPCGTAYVVRALPHGRIDLVDLPHSVGNVLLIGTQGGDLVLQHATDCDGGVPRSELSLVNPRTYAEKVLSRLPRSEAFGPVLVAGETRASRY